MAASTRTVQRLLNVDDSKGVDLMVRGILSVQDVASLARVSRKQRKIAKIQFDIISGLAAEQLFQLAYKRPDVAVLVTRQLDLLLKLRTYQLKIQLFYNHLSGPGADLIPHDPEAYVQELSRNCYLRQLWVQHPNVRSQALLTQFADKSHQNALVEKFPIPSVAGDPEAKPVSSTTMMRCR